MANHFTVDIQIENSDAPIERQLESFTRVTELLLIVDARREQRETREDDLTDTRTISQTTETVANMVIDRSVHNPPRRK
jgi:hypothetical protein